MLEDGFDVAVASLGQADDLSLEALWVLEEDRADAFPVVLGLVAGPDAAPGGSDLSRPSPLFTELVEEGVMRQEEVGAV